MTDDEIAKEAERRHSSHVDHPTHRPLSEDYELIGLRGEQALAIAFGLAVDLSAKPGGDGGKDNTLVLHNRHGLPENFVVDVKTSRLPISLLVEEGKCVPTTIYVLAGYDAQRDAADLLGWEWGSVVIKVLPQDHCGHGIISHSIPREKLRLMSELLRRQPRTAKKAYDNDPSDEAWRAAWDEARRQGRV